MTSTPKTPEDTLRDDQLKASIWKNQNERGIYYSTTFARVYRDEQGQWRDSTSFYPADLLKLAELSRAAYARIQVLRQQDRAQTTPKNDGDERAAFYEKRLPARASTPERTHQG